MRAAGRGPVHPAANMKKNRAACARDGRVGVVPDLDQPVVSEISRAHFLVGVIVGRIFRVDDDMAVVIW